MTVRGQPLLRKLRDTLVLVVHPADEDGSELTRQLQRIGCRVRRQWPPPQRLDDDVDVVFALVERSEPAAFLAGDAAAACAFIAILDYEDPALLDLIIGLGARGVVTKPIRAFGILGTLLTARTAQRDVQRLGQKVAKLEDQLRARREIERSIRILMARNGLSEADAYRALQRLAMEHRQSLGAAAATVVSADAVLSTLGPAPGTTPPR
jgi:AmiR/NasT family two-component response regulator